MKCRDLKNCQTCGRVFPAYSYTCQYCGPTFLLQTAAASCNSNVGHQVMILLAISRLTYSHGSILVHAGQVRMRICTGLACWHSAYLLSYQGCCLLAYLCPHLLLQEPHVRLNLQLLMVLAVLLCSRPIQALIMLNDHSVGCAEPTYH